MNETVYRRSVDTAWGSTGECFYKYISNKEQICYINDRGFNKTRQLITSSMANISAY